MTRNQKRAMTNSIFFGVIIFFSLSILIPLALIFGHIFKEGISSIHWSFFVNLPKPVGEAGGGIANALVGSIMLVLGACAISIPPGILIGVFLSEYKHLKLANSVRICVEVLQGIPSIVIGILAYLWVVRPMGGFNALSGSVALAIMMLPVVIRTTEETLLLIPKSLKEASLALGAPYYATILKVVLPAGISGIVTGVLVSVARIAGETAPLLFTAFGNPFINFDMTKPVHSLPLVIFNYAISPYEDWHKLAWGASLVLILFILIMNISAKAIASLWRTRS